MALCETIQFPSRSKPETGPRTRDVVHTCRAKGAGGHGTRYAMTAIINSQSSFINSSAVQLYEYSVYGQVAASDPNHPNPFLFTGRRFDTDTGLYYYRARYYNPYIGRFLQTDPGRVDINLYKYCRNNPLGFVDPSGCRTAPDPCDPCDPFRLRWPYWPEFYSPIPASRLITPKGNICWDPHYHCNDQHTILVIPAAYRHPDEMRSDNGIDGDEVYAKLMLDFMAKASGCTIPFLAAEYAKSIRNYAESLENLAFKMSATGSRGYRAFILVQDEEWKYDVWPWQDPYWTDVGDAYWVEVRGLLGWYEEWYGYHTPEQAIYAALRGADYYPLQPPWRFWCRQWQDEWDEVYNGGPTQH